MQRVSKSDVFQGRFAHSRLPRSHLDNRHLFVVPESVVMSRTVINFWLDTLLLILFTSLV